MSSGPGTEYKQRLQVRLEAVEKCDAQDRRVALVRLVLVAVAVTLGVLAWKEDTVSWWWLVAPAAGFSGLVIWHDRVRVARRRAQRAVDFYGRGLRRVADDWIGTGSGGDRYLDENHPYAADLDLFGEGSLFELLSLARTRSGEETLAGWLTTLAPAAEVVERQGAVQELPQLMPAGFEVIVPLPAPLLVTESRFWVCGAKPLRAISSMYQPSSSM